jgi:hypothetical protein
MVTRDCAAAAPLGTRAGATAQPWLGVPLPVQLDGACTALAPVGSIEARLAELTPLAAACGVALKVMPALLPAARPPVGKVKVQRTSQPAARLPE